MSEVKREHLAGLELALSRLQHHLAHENVKALHELIGKASAAPEQSEITGKPECSLGYGHAGHWCGPEVKCWLDPRSKENRDYENSEVTQLRADLVKARRNEHNSEVAYRAAIDKQDEMRGRLEAATQRADAAERQVADLQAQLVGVSLARDAAERKLGEALAIIERVKVKELVSPNCPLGKRIDALLSNSAEPVADHCPGDGVNACKDCPDRVELREACKRFVVRHKPAKGGDGEAV